MVIRIQDYQSVAEFSKRYKKADGTIGCDRSYIMTKVKAEIAKPNSTEIDVLLVGKRGEHVSYHVKYKSDKTTDDLTKLRVVIDHR